MSAFVKNCTGLSRRDSPSPDEDDSSSSRGRHPHRRSKKDTSNGSDFEQSLRRKAVITPDDVMKLTKVCRGECYLAWHHILNHVNLLYICIIFDWQAICAVQMQIFTRLTSLGSESEILVHLVFCLK